ncbi:MAG TPA: DUF192 domain-containing protein [Acidimicrobiales bacterium]|nr:DUF192 domain-containing protein [Acidimicrobiales bacterium]
MSTRCRLLLVVVVALVGAACAGDGGGSEAAPTTTTTTPTTTTTTPTTTTTTEAEGPQAGRRPLEGVSEVAIRISPEGAAAAVWCAMLAEDQAARSRGLMEQLDLRGYDGMVFRFPEPSEGRFFMRNTRIPLSIAFFAPDGAFVSATDMEPCPDDVERCPTYGADAPYLHALEVAQGDLPAMGVGPGAVLSFPGGGCPA